MAYPDDGDPKSIRVLDALIARLETITTANSYHHTVMRVLLYETDGLPTDVLPAIGVIPLDDSPVRELTCDARERRVTMALLLALAHVPGTREWKTEIHWLRADVEVALRNPDDNLGGLTSSIDIEEITADDAHPHEGLVFCTVSISITYRYSITNPST